MKIISGTAANLELDAPPETDRSIRPTLVRTRKALFDHLGDLTGKRVLDLCAGAGCLGLEAASRGAQLVVAVEKNSENAALISGNWEKVRRTGARCDFKIAICDICEVGKYSRLAAGSVDLVLADPPYEISAQLFSTLMDSQEFKTLCSGATLCWAIPDAPGSIGEFFFPAEKLHDFVFRKFGSTDFLVGEV